MDYIDGRIITTPEINGFSKSERNTICVSLAETLAKLHKVDYRSMVSIFWETRRLYSASNKIMV